MFSSRTSRFFLLTSIVILVSLFCFSGHSLAHVDQTSSIGQSNARSSGKGTTASRSKQRSRKSRRRHKRHSGGVSNINASNLNAAPSSSPSPSPTATGSATPSPTPSPSPAPTPCPVVEKTSLQSVKISSQGLEISGFPPWVNITVLVGAGIFFVASLLLARKAVKGDSGGYVIAAIIAGIVFLLLLFFVGIVYSRSRATSEINGKVERAKQESRGELPPAAPIAPSDLTASPVSASQINLSWGDNSDTEEGFKIERKLGAEGTYAPLVILGPNATSYADGGLAPETNASYRVKAFNGPGQSSYSNEANGITSVSAAPKCNDNTWYNPATWFWYVILPTLILVVVLVWFPGYLLFRAVRRREYRHFEEMR